MTHKGVRFFGTTNVPQNDIGWENEILRALRALEDDNKYGIYIMLRFIKQPLPTQPPLMSLYAWEA